MIHSVERTSLEKQSAIHNVSGPHGNTVWRHWQALTARPLEPLVLLHGGSGSWLHWIKTIEPQRAQRDVWCVDIPGLGDSAMPPPPATPESAARVLAEGFAALFPEPRRPHLLGFSFGSHVAAYLARGIGQRLSSFTLTGSAALGLDHPNFIFAKERAGQPEAESRTVHRENLAILMFADPRRIDDLAIDIQAENVRRARFKSRIFAATDDIPRLLPTIATSIGAIWGAHDNILEASRTPLDDVFAILRKARPDVRTAIVDDAGHWAAYEASDAFNAAVKQMLEGFER